MSGTDPDIEIHETDAPPPPSGTPPEFRELIALTLKTTAADVLDAAEQDFRGTWPSVADYVRTQIADHLPPHMAWLLKCCEPVKLRAGYENGAVFIWTITLPDGRVLLFESQREPGRRRPRE